MITVYHGSSVPVEKPSLSYSEPGTDFGKGFYVTADLNLAKKWAFGATPTITQYALDTDDLAICKFDADEKWVDLVIHNRSGKVSDEFSGYDIIFGPVVDDKLFSVIDFYERGYAAIEVIMQLIQCSDIGTQICIKTDKGINSLTYQDTMILTFYEMMKIREQNQAERNAIDKVYSDLLRKINGR